MESPRVFVSYSWTSPEHEEWVLNLATELRENGVDIVLDKWDLREGHDKYKFMEQMVTDPSVSRVIAICDCTYVKKANARSGGVGTESQIISREVYERVDQTKFVAIVSELDEDSRPCVPAYFTGRIHIDMSTEATRRDNFEQLLRWIYDKPVHQKPPLGTPPELIRTESAVVLGTSSRQRRAIDAIKLERASAAGATADYLDTLEANLDRLPLIPSANETPGDTLLSAIDLFTPYRDEFVDVVMAAARYRDEDELYAGLSDFFEKLLRRSYLTTHNGVARGTAEIVRLLAYELLIYFTAALLKNRRYRRLHDFLATEFHIPDPTSTQGRLRTYEAFQRYPQSLIDRKLALRVARFSMLADLMHARASRRDLGLYDLVEADFVLFVYSAVAWPDRIKKWDPYVALLAGDTGALPLFDRARSVRVFTTTVAEVFGVKSKKELLDAVQRGMDRRWQEFWERIDAMRLMNETLLASRE